MTYVHLHALLRNALRCKVPNLDFRLSPFRKQDMFNFIEYMDINRKTVLPILTLASNASYAHDKHRKNGIQ